ncbi:MAG TPA: zf-HC2 domain-containing protein [Bacteroidota bacterium]|nr:zf-HC2 domain-containing protein [Bacteroidota bacterium]
MNAHTETQLTLYDYLRGELDENDRASVESHLAECAACREECAEMREALESLPPRLQQPSDALPDAFWKAMLDGVDQTIAEKSDRPGLQQRISVWRGQVADWLTMAVVPHRRLVLGVVSIAIVATSAFVTWSLLRQSPERPVLAASPAGAASTEPGPAPTPPAAETRMDSYLRKSRMLLVGLTNMPDVEGQPVDLSVERKTSRELADEARALKQQTLDDRSLDLINELETIQIELANMESRNEMPTMALVRSGIERENRLFKIRIQEAIQLKVSYANEE